MNSHANKIRHYVRYAVFAAYPFFSWALTAGGVEATCTEPDFGSPIHNNTVSQYGGELAAGKIREADDVSQSQPWETNERRGDFICVQTAAQREQCFEIIANYVIAVNNVIGCDSGPCPGTGTFNEYVAAENLAAAGVQPGDPFTIYAPQECSVTPPPPGADDTGDTPPPPPPPGIEHTEMSCSIGPARSLSASKATGSCSHEVITDRGEERYVVADLRIPGRGFDWHQTRVYRNRRDTNTPMGHNWSHPYQDYLLVLSDQSIRGFTGPDPGENARGDNWPADPQDPQQYLPPRGFFSTLSQQPQEGVKANGGTTFLLTSRDGTRREYGQPAGAAYYLTAQEDRFGNRMEFFYDDPVRPHLLTRAIETLGRTIFYDYYASDDSNPGRWDRLATITDFFDRVISYDYDDAGNLIQATSPAVIATATGNDFPNGKQETYTYSFGHSDPALNHNLLSVTRPNENDPNVGLPAEGTPTLQWTYDANDRVLTHTIGTEGGPDPDTGGAGGTLTYSYEANPVQPSDFDVTLEDQAVFKTTETDRNGNVRAYWSDDFGNIVRFEHFTRGLRPDEPDKYLTRYKIDPNSQIPISVQNPEQDRREYILDAANPDVHQRANVLTQTHRPGPRGGDQAEKRWRFAYDPFYNQLALSVDPRGTDPKFIPANGGVVTPGRYALTETFDYQEGDDNNTHKQAIAAKLNLTLAQVNALINTHETQVETALDLPVGSYTMLGRGDINGDSRTDQLNGKIIKMTSPTVTLLPDSEQADLEGDTNQEIETFRAYDDNGLILYSLDAEGNNREYHYFDSSDPNGDGDTSEFEDPVNDPVGGQGYLKEILVDDEALAGQLSSIKPRRASDPNNDGSTADGFPLCQSPHHLRP